MHQYCEHCTLRFYKYVITLCTSDKYLVNPNLFHAFNAINHFQCKEHQKLKKETLCFFNNNGITCARFVTFITVHFTSTLKFVFILPSSAQQLHSPRPYKLLNVRQTCCKRLGQHCARLDDAHKSSTFLFFRSKQLFALKENLKNVRNFSNSHVCVCVCVQTYVTMSVVCTTSDKI
jgi:hypothetical protein